MSWKVEKMKMSKSMLAVYMTMRGYRYSIPKRYVAVSHGSE
jgi:hypothetical protein